MSTKALNEAALDLIKELVNSSPLMYSRQEDISRIVISWARNNFEQFGISCSIDTLDAHKHTGDYKAHLVRKSLCDVAVELGAKHGFGESVTQMPWDDRVSFRNKDYGPAFMPRKNIPMEVLTLTFVCLKRRPTSWYRSETTEEWMNKIIQPHDAGEIK